jgi:hypothetical protein
LMERAEKFMVFLISRPRGGSAVDDV